MDILLGVQGHTARPLASTTAQPPPRLRCQTFWEQGLHLGWMLQTLGQGALDVLPDPRKTLGPATGVIKTMRDVLLDPRKLADQRHLAVGRAGTSRLGAVRCTVRRPTGRRIRGIIGPGLRAPLGPIVPFQAAVQIDELDSEPQVLSPEPRAPHGLTVPFLDLDVGSTCLPCHINNTNMKHANGDGVMMMMTMMMAMMMAATTCVTDDNAETPKSATRAFAFYWYRWLCTCVHVDRQLTLCYRASGSTCRASVSLNARSSRVD